MLSLMSLISYIAFTDSFSLVFTSSSSERLYYSFEYLLRDLILPEDLRSFNSNEWLVVLGVDESFDLFL